MWTRQQNVWFIAAAAAILSYFAVRIFQPYFEPIIWAITIVVLLHPVYRWLARKTKREGAAAGLAVLLALFIVIVPAITVSVMLGAQAIELYQKAEITLRSNSLDEIAAKNPLLERGVAWLRGHGYLEPGALQERLLGSLREGSATVVASTAMILKNVTLFVFKSVLALVAMYYFFRNGQAWLRGLLERLPMQPREKAHLVGRIRDVIAATVYGSLVVAIVQGTLGGIAFAIAGLPGAIFWGVVMAFLSLLPMGGAALVWIPGAIYLMVTGDLGWGIFVVVWGVAVVSSIDNVLRPMILGGKTRLHPLVVLFAVLGGLQLFGFQGILLGPLIISLAAILLELLTIELHEIPEPQIAAPAVPARPE